MLSACVTTVPPSIPLGPGVTTVPYAKTPRGLFYVEAMVDGQGPFPFVIDTGASSSALFEDFARAQGIFINEEDQIFVRGLLDVGERPSARLETFELGNITVEDMRVIVLAGGIRDFNVAGVIGLDLFGDGAILMNDRDRTFTIAPPGALNSDEVRGWDKVPLLRAPEGAPDFGLRFARFKRGPDIDFLTLVDTGSDFSSVNWVAADLIQPIRGLREQLRRQWEVQGAIGSFRPRALVTFETLTLGERDWRDVDVVVLELDSLDVIGAETGPFMIAGANLFADRSFIVDFENDLMLMTRDPRRQRGDVMILRNPADIRGVIGGP